jgi:hypothetical protein
MWDIEVDVACIGAGIGGLANAIATVDAGGEVLVADATPAGHHDAGRDNAHGSLRERVQAKRGWLTGEVLDAETEQYFTAVSDGLVEPSAAHGRSVPVRVARNLSPEEAFGRVVEPFVGSRLTDWASQCFASPYGLMYTSMRDWPTTPMRSAAGDAIEVMSLGTIDDRDGFRENALHRWMSEQARQRDIEVRAASTLERLVFEDGAIVGLVLSTPDGPQAVRTRSGITFAPREQDAAVDAASNDDSGERLQVCVVGRTASRFGRVELLATEPAAPARPTCTGSRRQYRDGMHDYRQPTLEGWRCGKVHGHTTFGE